MRYRVFLLSGLLAWGGVARAEVIDSGASGFTVRSVTRISAEPAKVWDTLTAGVGRWWDPEHTYSGSAANLSMDARPGGCFCEKLEGGGVEHMRVVYAAPGKSLRLAGALGPLQQYALAGSQTWILKPVEGGTELTLTYAVGGYVPDGAASFAAPVDAVLAGQVSRLKQFVETGSVSTP